MVLKIIKTIVIIFFFITINSQTMKKQFYKDRKHEIEKLNNDFSNNILTEEKLSKLPKPIQNHFKISGFVGKPIAMNADIIWESSFLKLKPNQSWKSLKTKQFNSVNPIMRTAFMKVNKMFFAGKDLYKNGQGTMKGKILNLFTVINVSGKEISQSALVTSFCEMMLLSGYSFQDYIEWEEIDDFTVKAKLKDNNIIVNGTFFFDKEGKFERFETDERFYDIGNGVFKKKKFVANINSYKKTGNYYHPKNVSVSWYLEGGKHEYFKGTIEKINYNVK